MVFKSLSLRKISVQTASSGRQKKSPMKHNYIKSALFGLLSLIGVPAIAQTIFTYTGSTANYVVPAGVTSISIEANGAKGSIGSGGGVGGNGATMYGEFTVVPGDILVVYAGGNPAGTHAGGDGSWVNNSTSGTLLIVAGGGGSGAWVQIGGGAPTTNDGTTNPSHPGYADGAIGTGGNGGGAGTGNWGTGGGGGWLSAGSNGFGSTGGAIQCKASLGTTYAGGAGGGYSGGGGVDMDSGWGTGGGGAGGSYNIGINQANLAAANAGLGEVTITDLCIGLITSVSSDSVCEGETVTLSASSAGTGTVTWDGGVTDGVPFAPPVGTTTYSATSDDGADCGFSVDIVVSPLPTVDAGTDLTVCEGDSVTLAGSGTADTYSWDGGVVDGVGFVPVSTATYTVTGDITASGCFATDDVDVTVTTIDESVSAAGGTLTSNQAGATYQWIDCFDNSDIPGETNQSYTPVQNGDYAVIVTIGGCSDTSACQNVSGIGFDEETVRTTSVYPNPSKGEVKISAQGSFSYDVFTATGKAISVGNGIESASLNLTGQPAGVYLIRVTNASGVTLHKVTLQ